LAILAGAMLTSIIPAIRQRRWDQNHYAGDQFIDAIIILQTLWNRDADTLPRLSRTELQSQTGIPEDALNDTLNQLQALGYASSNDETDEERWILACDPRQASLNPLIDTWLLNRQQSYLADHPEIGHAIAYTLFNHPIKLEALIETPQT